MFSVYFDIEISPNANFRFDGNSIYNIKKRDYFMYLKCVKNLCSNKDKN